MAGYPVDGDQYRGIDRKMSEIKRQLCLPGGSSLDPERVVRALQKIVEGNFDGLQAGVPRLIDCDTAPWCPYGWRVEEHRPGGQLEFDPAKVAFHLDDGQKNGRTIVGNELRKHLAEMPVMNANVLDHLLANPQLIPDSWKMDADGYPRDIYFWGTVYRSGVSLLCVRCLCRGGGQWRWNHTRLDREWNAPSPAALSAS